MRARDPGSRRDDQDRMASQRIQRDKPFVSRLLKTARIGKENLAVFDRELAEPKAFHKTKEMLLLLGSQFSSHRLVQKKGKLRTSGESKGVTCYCSHLWYSF